MRLAIRPSYGGVEEEERVVDEVGGVSERVEGDEIRREAEGGFVEMVVDDLWVEGEGPGEGVDPTEEVGDGEWEEWWSGVRGEGGVEGAGDEAHR